MNKTELIAAVAEKAGVADRTYANIERGSANMRIETLVRICSALNATPNDILTTGSKNKYPSEADIIEMFNRCTEIEKQTAIALIDVYLHSIV